MVARATKDVTNASKNVNPPQTLTVHYAAKTLAKTWTIVLLTVPLIAAFGGLLFAGEPLTWSFVGSAILVLGGVALVIRSKA